MRDSHQERGIPHFTPQESPLRKSSPTCSFDGCCEEALTSTAKGAQVTALMRYRKAPSRRRPATLMAGDKITHANLQIGETQITAPRRTAPGRRPVKGFALDHRQMTPKPAPVRCLPTAARCPGPIVFATAFGM